MSRHRDNCPLDCKVYVGELGNNGTRHELEEAFGYYGPLKNVWVARNPPGFAFVMFEDSRDARDACRSLNGKLICGRRVRVELSSGKTRREMAGDGRPGGPGGSRSPSPVGRYGRDRPPPPSRGGDYGRGGSPPPMMMHRHRGRSPRSPPPRRRPSPNGRASPPPARRPISPRGGGRSPPDAYARRGGYDDYPARSRSPVGRRPISRSISRSRSRSPMP